MSGQAWAGRRGQVVIILAVAMPVLFAMLAILVDIGFAYARREMVRGAADAAALAALRMAAAGGTDAQIAAAAADYAGRNDASLDWEGCFYVDGAGNALGAVGTGVVPGGATGVEVRAGKSLSTFFGGMFGRPVLPVWMRSRAVLGSAGPVPFGVPDQPYEANQTYWIVGEEVGWHELYGSDLTDLGLLDYRGKSQKDDIAADVANGYAGQVQVGVVYPQPNGNMNSAVKEGVETRLAQGRSGIVVPVVEVSAAQRGQGQSTTKTVLGFAAFSLNTPFNNNGFGTFDGSAVQGVYQGTVAPEDLVVSTIKLSAPSQ